MADLDLDSFLDNLDDLLDDDGVGNDSQPFSPSPEPQPPAQPKPQPKTNFHVRKPTQPQPRRPVRCNTDDLDTTNDLDSLLSSIGDIDAPGDSFGVDLSHLANQENNDHSTCYPVCLSGPNDSKGCSTVRCLGCDFKIVKIPGHKWNSDVAYLFFRNNTPDAFKLKKGATRTSGWNAFCCQCSWIDVNQMENIQNHSELRWVCGGH